MSLKERSIGLLLGLVCGDILGAPVEGYPGEMIKEMNNGELKDFKNRNF